MTKRDVICVFPGQGSQYPGMGVGVANEFKEFSYIFEEASDALSLDIVSLLNSDESTLKLTSNAQPCLLTVSYLYYKILESRLGITPVLFAGHSLGEYSALCAASRLDFSTAVALVRKRGTLMQEAVPYGVGGMMALVGSYPDLDLNLLCSECSTQDDYVAPANYNSPQQVVVSGHLSAIDRLSKKLSDLSVKCIPLNVSAPFHSKLMLPAKEGMRSSLNQTKLNENGSTISPNIFGDIRSTYEISYLIDQIDSPVMWTQTNMNIEKTYSSNCESTPIYIEVGSGKVLSNLAKRSFKASFTIVPTDNFTQSLSLLEGALSR